MGDLREKSPIDIYHVYNRGNNQEYILKTDDEKNLYLFYFNTYIRYTDIKVHCMTLMGNHSHKILEGSLKEISWLMKYFQSKFAKHYNMLNDRTGHVFDGPFKSNPTLSSGQYTTLYRYLSMNAVKAGLVEDPFSYDWCSINPKFKPGNLVSEKEILRFFNLEGLNFDKFIRDKTDDRISYFDRKEFNLQEATVFFNDQLIRYSLHSLRDFHSSADMLIQKIIKTCRYYGISIKQLNQITKLSCSYIQKCVPSKDDYI
ncbi:MAG TPA: hypothetical protein PLP30_10815 [Clostridia bacterium]|nr:hypothetical protein [Clostridia bacterium]HRX43056.1 hypothetical protein [Clostridia bacterium]